MIQVFLFRFQAPGCFPPGFFRKPGAVDTSGYLSIHPVFPLPFPPQAQISGGDLSGPSSKLIKTSQFYPSPRWTCEQVWSNQSEPQDFRWEFWGKEFSAAWLSAQCQGKRAASIWESQAFPKDAANDEEDSAQPRKEASPCNVTELLEEGSLWTFCHLGLETSFMA